METNWINEDLYALNSESVSDIEINKLISEKLKKINHKLYKYCSFSKNDSNYSLSNLKNGIIYFSKPSDFNDPFDCALGFSIDETIKSLLPSIIDKNISSDNKNKELIKKFINAIFCNELLGNLISPKEFASLPLTEIIKNDKSNLNFIFMLELIKNPKLLEIVPSYSDLSQKDKNTLNILSSIITENTITGKIEKLMELTGHNKDIDFKKINADIKLVEPKIKEIINNKFAITCFSTTPDNILMWSHYANKHRGFCVEYDLSKIKIKDILLFLHPIKYSEKRPVIPMTIFDFSDLHNIKISNNKKKAIADIFIALLTKCKIWEYENEWRIIYPQTKLDNLKLNEDIVTKVYYGANISESNKKQIDTIIREKKIESVQYKLDSNNFKLTVK